MKFLEVFYFYYSDEKVIVPSCPVKKVRTFSCTRVKCILCEKREYRNKVYVAGKIEML